jgi:hypothetical protein
MWGYYDESGEYDGRGNLLNMTIGGCFASLDRWLKSDSEWQRALADHGLTYFHMTEFEAWKPPFDFMLDGGGRDQAKHRRLLNALLDIMLAHVDGFYGFGAVSMFDPEKPELSHQILMEDCVGGAIKNAVLEVADFYGGVSTLSSVSRSILAKVRFADTSNFTIMELRKAESRPSRLPIQRPRGHFKRQIFLPMKWPARSAPVALSAIRFSGS